MLGLTRKPGQSLILTHETTGERIEVHVNRITPNNVKMAIDAPQCWRIVRSELVETITDLQRLSESSRDTAGEAVIHDGMDDE